MSTSPSVKQPALLPTDVILHDRRAPAPRAPDRRTMLLLVDGDDTLWMTEHLYDDARRRSADIVSAAGLDSSRWTTLQHEIDRKNVGRFGLSAIRFPTSSVEALRETALGSGVAVDDDLEEKVRDASASVFEAVAPLANRAVEALEAISRLGVCVLLTQGDPSVQAKRLADSGLESFFEAAVVVEKKDRQCYERMSVWLGVPAERCWMIGNSIPSDINPANEAGMNAVWIDAYVWHHERREQLGPNSRAFKASGLAEAADLIHGRMSK